MMLHDSNEEKITLRELDDLKEICGMADVREGACLCRWRRVALHFWVGSLNAKNTSLCPT